MERVGRYTETGRVIEMMEPVNLSRDGANIFLLRLFLANKSEGDWTWLVLSHQFVGGRKRPRRTKSADGLLRTWSIDMYWTQRNTSFLIVCIVQERNELCPASSFSLSYKSKKDGGRPLTVIAIFVGIILFICCYVWLCRWPFVHFRLHRRQSWQHAVGVAVFVAMRNTTIKRVKLFIPATGRADWIGFVPNGWC